MKVRSAQAMVAAAAIAGASLCHAQAGGTYRCVDDRGRSTYTNVKEEMTGKKCSIVSREVSVIPGNQPVPQAKPAAPAAAPNPATGRVSERRKILEEELSGEEKRLGAAREKLAEQQSIRNGDERNYQRVLDRLKPFIDTVEQHEKNIEQLKRELSTIR